MIRLNPGNSFLLTQTGSHFTDALPWVHPRGDQNVDYVYSSNVTAPTTAEIARHFPNISGDQQKRIDHFCEHEILQRYIEIGPPHSQYFQKKRLWRLTLVSATEQYSYYYLICDEFMQRLEAPDRPLGWSTSIPTAKLFSAIEHGETLTSLYLRINETVFDPITELELETVDLLEDPLIRTLYNGVFAAYQKNQLRRLSLPSPPILL